MLQVWNDKTCVNDKIYDLTIVKKPYAIDLHVKFINGVDGQKMLQSLFKIYFLL